MTIPAATTRAPLWRRLLASLRRKRATPMCGGCGFSLHECEDERICELIEWCRMSTAARVRRAGIEASPEDVATLVAFCVDIERHRLRVSR